MSYKFSMSQCRFAFLLMCSMLLGLRGAVAQSGPEFLQQRGVPDTVHSEVLNEDRLIYVDFPLSYTPGSAQKYPGGIFAGRRCAVAGGRYGAGLLQWRIHAGYDHHWHFQCGK